MALLLGTHWPKLPPIGPEGTDKVLHFSAYAGLGFLLSLSVFLSRKVRWWHLLAIFIAVAAFGGCDELTQPPFGRTADWFDWFADISGAIVGISLGALANRLLRQSSAQKSSQEGQ
jgi:VanZ family protein